VCVCVCVWFKKMAAGFVIGTGGPRVVYPWVKMAYECKNMSGMVPKSHKQHARARAHTHTHTLIFVLLRIFQCHIFTISSNKIQ
jgi:hypothetical protein